MYSSYKHEIKAIALLILLAFTFFKLYEIILPFIFGILLAVAVNPIIGKIQRIIKGRNAATSVFLMGIVGFITVLIFFFSYNINRDFKRLNDSFSVLASENKVFIDDYTNKAKNYISNLFPLSNVEETVSETSVAVQKSMQKRDVSKIDTEVILESLAKVRSAFSSEKSLPNVPKKKKISGTFILFSTIAYFVLILYSYEYFSSIRKRYFYGKIKSRLGQAHEDFSRTFGQFFRLRSKIVFILTGLYALAFAILDVPGMIALTALMALLSYIPYLPFLALIPLALSCLVLAVERNHSFLLLYGIVIVVFVLLFVLDQLFLTPRIMESKFGIHPVILLFSLSIWTYLFGLTGLFLGIPLTSLLIIYLKRYFLSSYEELIQEPAEDEQIPEEHG
jgi:predicted PurR-regulated permease PerM